MSNPSVWSIALPTMAGALVGAFVGILGIWWQSHRELKERYESRLISSLANVMKEISVYATFLKSRTDDEDVKDFDLIAAIDIALMVARDKDLEMVRLIKRATLTDRVLPKVNLQVKLSGLSAEISDWRSKEGLSKKERYKRYYKRIEKWTISKS